MSTNSTQQRFPSSQEVIEQILKGLELAPVQIAPLGVPWYNKFVFKIDLSTAVGPDSFPQQPGTTPPPASGVFTLVLQFPDPRAYGFNNANRIENNVAAQQLVRQAFQASGLPDLIPDTYAWAPYRPEIEGGKGLGWILSEFRPGEELAKVFSALSLGEKMGIVPQVANILACIQGMELPAGVTKFGGLTFNDVGQIVDGQPPIVEGGPWDTFEDVWHAELRAALRTSEREDLVLLGWKQDGIRDRIDRFVSDGGVQKLLDTVNVDERVLVHGSFTTWNMLYDGNSRRITTFLGFDTASVTHPCQEYFHGLDEFGSRVRLEREDNSNLVATVLSGNFEKVPLGLSDEQRDKWELARGLDIAFADRDVIRLSSIDGIEKLMDLGSLVSLICPTELRNKYLLKGVPREAQEQKRAEYQAKLLACLERYGY